MYLLMFILFVNVKYLYTWCCFSFAKMGFCFLSLQVNSSYLFFIFISMNRALIIVYSNVNIVLKYIVFDSFTKMWKTGNSQARKLKKVSKCRKYYSNMIYWRKESKVVDIWCKNSILFMSFKEMDGPGINF